MSESWSFIRTVPKTEGGHRCAGSQMIPHPHIQDDHDLARTGHQRERSWPYFRRHAKLAIEDANLRIAAHHAQLRDWPIYRHASFPEGGPALAPTGQRRKRRRTNMPKAPNYRL